MIKKNIIIGFVAGLVANFVGFLVATLTFGKSLDVINTINLARQDDLLGKLISIGAILNLLIFFLFIRKKQDYRARGVILATLLIAIITLILNYF